LWAITTGVADHSGVAGSVALGAARALFISYDGVLEPLGESQVVTYLERLTRLGRISLISFEKKKDYADKGAVERMRTRLAENGIKWIPLRYHKRPLVISTAYDVLKGIAVGALLVPRGRFQVVHARGYVPALIALALKRLFGMRFLFDMRGFWADEKVDAGHWTESSLIYRITKRWERRFFESADGIVSLTQAGVAAFASLGYRIRNGIPIAVVPTCTDLQRFAPGPKDPALMSRFGLDSHLVIGCTGTMSNWYLREPMLECLSYLARLNDRVKILIVTRENHDQLRIDARRAGIPDGRLVLTQVPFAAMPDYLRLMDLGLFFIKPCFSKKGSSATKLGEFLATGVPVVINDGIGDSGAIVRNHGVGVVLSSLAAEEFETAAKAIEVLLKDPLRSRRCCETAEKYFDLKAGVEKYDALYARLVGAPAP
jgi:glycosyltransferase involved in cell wall biosynthesis